MSSSANARQEGGVHYRQPEGVPQHWDLTVMYQWDPFQYQITKYIMRWKDKHEDPAKKLEDLRKCRHFLDKYIENWEKFLGKPNGPVEFMEQAMKAQDTLLNQTNYTKHMEVVQIEGYVGGSLIDYRCKKCRLISRHPSLASFIREHDKASDTCNAFKE